MGAAILNDEEIVWTGTQSSFREYTAELWSGLAEFSELQESAPRWLADYSLDLPGRSLEEPALRPHPSSDATDAENRIWMISITAGFRKAITDVDRKLQGRVLEAITELTREPTILRGDTRKPLDAERKGCWRYRIGDWRLIYRPDATEHVVVLLDFAPRSGVYT